MKKVLLATVFLVASLSGFGADFIKELQNSIKRTDGHATYTLHFENGDKKIYTRNDFTSGEIVERGGVPQYFQMYNGSGDKKQNYLINLNNAVYYELHIEKIAGEWEYDFHFYYK